MISLLRSFAFVVLVLGVIGCSSGMRVPQDDMRASFNGSTLPQQSFSTSMNGEEPSAEVRALMLEKIKRHLLRTGDYPKNAIKKTELLSLTPTFTTQAPESSTWNYQALARVNLDHSSIKVRYLIFERDGEFVIRKISV